MNKNKVRIIHFIPGFLFGGIESRFFDWFDRIDKKNINFDLLIQTDQNNPIFDEFKKNGGKVYSIPKINFKNIIKYYRDLKKFFTVNKYEIVHCHSPDKSFFVLLAAKKEGIQTRILHARTSSLEGGKDLFIKNVFKKISPWFATDYFACSKEASQWLFGKKNSKKVKIVQNAVDSEKFIFNNKKRQEIRSFYNIQDNEFVLGHIGRFTYAKNHKFIIDIFSEYQEKNPESKLLLVGDGPLRDEIFNYVNHLGLTTKVIFTGYQPNVEDYYNSMDLFIFPSHYEGLPGTVIEAQTSGLNCLISNKISDEVILSDLVISLPIEDPTIWLRKINSNSKLEKRISPIEIIKDKGFDLNTVVAFLENFYLKKGKVNKGKDFYGN